MMGYSRAGSLSVVRGWMPSAIIGVYQRRFDLFAIVGVLRNLECGFSWLLILLPGLGACL